MMKNILLTGLQVEWKRWFYTNDYQSCPERVKYKSQAKYESKVLVWCAISEAGISEAFIGHVKTEAVTADIYIKNVYLNWQSL